MDGKRIIYLKSSSLRRLFRFSLYGHLACLAVEVQGEPFAFVEQGERFGQLLACRCLFAVSQHMAYAVTREHERYPLDWSGLEGGLYAGDAMLAVELLGQVVRHVA